MKTQNEAENAATKVAHRIYLKIVEVVPFDTRRRPNPSELRRNLLKKSVITEKFILIKSGDHKCRKSVTVRFRLN